MCYSASGWNQSYTHPTSCLECVNRGKMIFWVCCCYCLVSSNNVNSVMSPITSGMRHIPFPPHSTCLGGRPWQCGAPTVLIRLHVSSWHQPTALTYALYLQSSITMLSSQQSENMNLVFNGLRLQYVQHPSGPFAVCSHVVETGNGLRLKLESLSFCCALSSLTAQRRDKVWCVFWRPAALSTLRPLHWHYGRAEPLRVTGREGWGMGGVGGKGGSLQPGKRESERKRDRQRRRGEGCQLVWPAPRARGECSVQQTAW